MSASDQIRTYDRADSVVFLKTKEAFGGLSNMAGGFPLKVNGVRILTSEALYQACRFPHLPEVQRLIIDQKSPMTAKMKGKPHRSNSRPDWDQVKVKIMRWCLRVKLAQNWAKFSKLLLETGERPIVEESRRDDFWGAKPIDEQTLVGMNVLGRLLMELREEVKSRDRASLIRVEPLGISDFWLYGQPIQPVEADGIGDVPKIAPRLEKPAPPSAPPAKPVQASLFDQPPPNTKTKPWRKEVQQAAGSMDDLKPYPAMKDSGVPWLGEVPEHWEMERAKWLFRKMDRPARDTDEVVTCFRDGVVTLRRNRRVRGFTEALKEIGYQGIRRGDLVIHGMDAFAGAVGVADSDGKGTPVYSVCEPIEGVNSQYYAYLVREMARSQWILALAKGIRERSTDFRFDGFASQPVPFPPLTEQTAIVRFLDHMDRRIGRAIRAKQKLIALLNEQKKAIIHQAVTRGLDPNVRLKPSGVAWLGDVPEHWEVWQVGHFAQVGNGSTPSRGNMAYWKGGTYPWLNSSSVNHSPISDADQFVTNIALRECHLPRVQPGSVLVAITGQGKTRGTVALLSMEATINQHVVYMTPQQNLVAPEYLHLAFVGAYRDLRRISGDSGSTRGALTCGDISHFKVALPPRDEQNQICSSVFQDVESVDATVESAQREIALLREYRTRLIADVVTGKLDVREAAARLPEEAEEPEPVDEADVLEGGGDEAGEADLDEATEEAVA